MKLGIAMTLPHQTPMEWARQNKELGLEAVYFPLEASDPQPLIDEYVSCAKEQGLLIAEVGAWCNPIDPDVKTSKNNIAYCKRQLELAEYIGANCCVNIAGAAGQVWDGSYAENYSPQTYERIVCSVRDIIDAVKPKKTKYALEPMPHMPPDSPENYLKLLNDINRPGFGVHLDVVNMITSPQVYFNNVDLIDRCFALLGPAICSCHLKDAYLEHSLTVSIKEAECGKGGLDIVHYIEKIDEQDKNLPLIIEHLHEKQAFLDAVSYVKSLNV
nr:TIM barrel protein [bacterium]